MGKRTHWIAGGMRKFSGEIWKKMWIEGQGLGDEKSRYCEKYGREGEVRGGRDRDTLGRLPREAEMNYTERNRAVGEGTISQ